MTDQADKTTAPPPELPTLAVHTVLPGQRLVLTHPDYLPGVAHGHLHERVAEWWGGEGDPPALLILDGGAKLAAFSPEAALRRESDLLAANNRGHERNVRLSSALIALIERFERVDASPGDRAAINAAALVYAGVKVESVVEPGYLKAAGSIAAGGPALVDAFVAHRQHPRDNRGHVSDETAAILREFAAFAVDQMKARAASHAAGGQLGEARHGLVADARPQDDTRPMCKGDLNTLGTGCGNCARCDEAKRSGRAKGGVVTITPMAPGERGSEVIQPLRAALASERRDHPRGRTRDRQ